LLQPQPDNASHGTHSYAFNWSESNGIKWLWRISYSLLWYLFPIFKWYDSSEL